MTGLASPMRRPLVLVPLVLAAVAGAVLGTGSSADGARLPTAASYTATIDAAGFVRIRVNQDTTGVCVDGRDVVVEYTADFELGRPRKITVVTAPGSAFSSYTSNAGGAVHEARVTSYRETSDCPSNGRPVIPGRPTCGKHKGTLRAALTPTPLRDSEEDLTPLVRGVSISLQRQGGGEQDSECLSLLGSVAPRIDTSVISTLERPVQQIIVPLGVTDRTFLRLPKGRSVRRLVRLNGACSDVLASSGPALGRAAAAPTTCTVTGQIFVSVKR